MSVLYLPGCTLKNKAANFDQSNAVAMARLGVELHELERWNCCGTVFSMACDDLMQQLAPVRNLLRAEQVRILHMHCFSAGLWGRLAALLARTPIRVVTVHEEAGWLTPSNTPCSTRS